MGGAKSRKGKKAWRKNIDTTDVEEFRKESAHEAQRGPGVQSLQDQELFVVDKSADDALVPKSVLTKKAKAAKPLKAQIIVSGISTVQPVQQAPAARPRSALPPPRQVATAETAAAAPAPTKKQQRKRRAAAPVTDIWGNDATDPAEPSTSGRAANGSTAAAGDGWVEPPPQPTNPARKRQKQAAAPAKPAVEIDASGCSYNPDFEQHQDALAELVAAEHKKMLKKELAPRAPLPYAPRDYAPPDELTQLLGNAEEQQEEQEEQGDQHQEEDEQEDDAAAGSAGAAGSKKKTRVDRNRAARRKAAEREAEEKQRLKAQRRELERLGQLQQELEEDAAEKEARVLRRKVVAAEKAASQPPRLGKHRYQPTAPPVLTSDQITGSLRQLPPCFTVAKERFNSLQKRGLLEPRRPAMKKQGKRVVYVAGDRTHKALAAQEELEQLKQARAKLQKTAKAAGGGAAAGALDVWGAA